MQLQMDLVDMQQWSIENDGYRYILLAVDCFSRYAYSRPVVTKSFSRRSGRHILLTLWGPERNVMFPAFINMSVCTARMGPMGRPRLGLG